MFIQVTCHMRGCMIIHFPRWNINLKLLRWPIICHNFLNFLESLELNFKKQKNSFYFSFVQNNTPDKTIFPRFDPVKTPIEQGNELFVFCKWAQVM